MTSTAPWFYWALLSAVFAAFTAIFAKLGLESIESDLATFVRTGIIVLVLGAFVYATGKWSNPLEWPAKAWVFLTLSALATGASWLCYFRALQLGNASQVAPIDKSSIVMVAIFATLFLDERPSPREWAGILMIGTGVVVLGLKKIPFL